MYADTSAIAPPDTTPSSQVSQAAGSTSPAEESGLLTATTNGGDKVSATFAFSDLVQPSLVGDALSSCGALDTSRALVARMDVTVSVKSSRAAEVTIKWNPDMLNSTVGFDSFYLVSEYSDGASCDLVSNTPDLAARWSSVKPGTPGTFTGYWLFTKAGAQGDRKGPGQILLGPTVTVQQRAGTTRLSGQRHVECVTGTVHVSGFYVAGDRPTALAGSGWTCT